MLWSLHDFTLEFKLGVFSVCSSWYLSATNLILVFLYVVLLIRK